MVVAAAVAMLRQLHFRGIFAISETGEVDDAVGSDEDKTRKEQRRQPADGMSPHTVGNEDQLESEQAFGVDDDAELLPNDFYYDYAEHASKAAVSDESGLPPNLMTL